MSSKKGNKNIDVTVFKKTNKHIHITVIDNGIGRVASAKIKANKSINRKSIGLDLTKQRLKSFSKDLENNYSLRYYDLTNKNNKVEGTKVSIQIPLF